MIRKHTGKDVKHLFYIISGYRGVVKLGNYRQFFIRFVHIFATLVYIYLISMTNIFITFIIRKIYFKNKETAEKN